MVFVVTFIIVVVVVFVPIVVIRSIAYAVLDTRPKSSLLCNLQQFLFPSLQPSAIPFTISLLTLLVTSLQSSAIPLPFSAIFSDSFYYKSAYRPCTWWSSLRDVFVSIQVAMIAGGIKPLVFISLYFKPDVYLPISDTAILRMNRLYPIDIVDFLHRYDCIHFCHLC